MRDEATPAAAIDVCGSVCRFVLTPTYNILYNIQYSTTLPYTAVVSGTVHAYFYSRLHTTVIYSSTVLLLHHE